jgi:hypothetical protein
MSTVDRVNRVNEFQAAKPVTGLNWSEATNGVTCVTSRGRYHIRKVGVLWQAYYTGSDGREVKIRAKGQVTSLKKACRKHYDREAM